MGWCVRSRNICWPTNSSNKDRQLGIVVKNPGRKQIELNFFNNIVSRSIFKQTIFILFCDDMFFLSCIPTYLLAKIGIIPQVPIVITKKKRKSFKLIWSIIFHAFQNLRLFNL